MKNPATRNAAFFAVGGFAAALFLAGAAHAITDTVFNYSAVQTGYLGLPSAALLPQNSDTQYSSGDDGAYVRPSTNSDSCFKAVVNLPQGAKMTDFALWYATEGGTGSVQLFRLG